MEKKAQWENELQALTNALESLKMDGYKVIPNHNAVRRTTFFLTEPDGSAITGSWSYVELNHFIMGYGKRVNDFSLSMTTILERLTEWKENIDYDVKSDNQLSDNESRMNAMRQSTQLAMAIGILSTLGKNNNIYK